MAVHDESYQAARRVALAGVAVSGLLACSNIIIGLLTHSTSVVTPQTLQAVRCLTRLDAACIDSWTRISVADGIK